jgi:hypothetical protein
MIVEYSRCSRVGRHTIPAAKVCAPSAPTPKISLGHIVQDFREVDRLKHQYHKVSMSLAHEVKFGIDEVEK